MNGKNRDTDDIGINTLHKAIVSENRGSRIHLLLVFLLNRSAGKAKKDRFREGLLDGRQHFSEHGPVRLVYDEYQPFVIMGNRFICNVIG